VVDLEMFDGKLIALGAAYITKVALTRLLFLLTIVHKLRTHYYYYYFKMDTTLNLFKGTNQPTPKIWRADSCRLSPFTLLR